MMDLSINSTIRLNNGVQMPMLGFGTYKMHPEDTEASVSYALEVGYRHIDTATLYENEQEVGAAIRKSGIPRDEIFVTTKLWNTHHDDPEKAFKESLFRLGLSYVDLYLIHWPVENVRNNTWKILEKICKDGKCNSLGVSNYTITHLDELLYGGCDVVPAVNQVEFSPFLYQKGLLEYCRIHKIQLEAYSSLTRGMKFNDPTLVEIAEKYSKTPAQILIRWALQHRVVAIPKSQTKSRIKENSEVFDFSILNADMDSLNKLNQDFRVSWDPTNVP